MYMYTDFYDLPMFPESWLKLWNIVIDVLSSRGWRENPILFEELFVEDFYKKEGTAARS